MNFENIWNGLFYRIRKVNQNVPEDVFQIIVEELFEKIGWSKYKGEIVTQRTILLGSANRGKPDIVISDGNKDLFVVELKKPSVQKIERYAEQLFCYMRQLKVKLGVLLGDTLHVYYEISHDTKTPQKITEIRFEENSVEGIKLLNILCKNEYSPEKIEKYCKDKIVEKELIEKSDAYLNKLCSAEGTNLIIELLKQKIKEDFSEENAKCILNSISITVSKKNINIPITNILPNISKNEPGKRKSGQNNDKYKLNGEWAGGTRQNSGKGRFALATVKLYKKQNPSITMDDLNNTFSGIIGKKTGFVDTYDSASTKYLGQKKEERHFLDDPIDLSNGQIIVVTREWDPPRINKFIAKARELGFNIEVFEE